MDWRGVARKRVEGKVGDARKRVEGKVGDTRKRVDGKGVRNEKIGGEGEFKKKGIGYGGMQGKGWG